MNVKQTMMLLVLTVIGLTSCEKDLYDPSKNQETKKVTDLVIPEGFDWEMTKEATFNVTSNHSALLSIYLDRECSEGNLLATLPVKAGTDATLPLSILNNTQIVYVQYKNEAGETIVKDAMVGDNGKITFATPTDTASPKSQKAGVRAEGDFDDQTPGILFYPKSGWGTLMFEDNYPNLGDYDFNDFVARYSIKIYTTPDLENLQAIELEMNVAAIGGITPYIPCLRLPYNSNYIREATLHLNKGSDGELSLETTKDKSTKGNVVYIFNGAEKNAYKKGSYLNTEQGSKAPTKAFTLTVTFIEGTPFDNLNKNLFDIFLTSKEKDKEIHMLGYSPAFQEGNYSFIYDTAANTTYKQEKGLVWAISIPDGEVKHSLEKENFLKGYPDFGTWAESDGKSQTEWYKNAKTASLFQ